MLSIPPAFSLKLPSMPAGKRMLSVKDEVFGRPGDGQQYKEHSCERESTNACSCGGRGAPTTPPTVQSDGREESGWLAGHWSLHPWGKTPNLLQLASVKGWFAAGGSVVSQRRQSITLPVRLQHGSSSPLPDTKLCLGGPPPQPRLEWEPS